MIKNYIFDFGNVLANFHPYRLTAPFVQGEDMIKIISNVVFDRIYWDKLDDGSITDDEVKADFSKRLPENMRVCAYKVYDNWISSMTPVPGMQELIYDIKNMDKKLYLLSNISIGFADGYKNVEWINELLGCFDGLVFSGQIGLIKPNREIFEYLLNTFSLNPEECLFIDDSKKNILGAKAVGIAGYLFDGDANSLRKEILGGCI